jgi:glycosyltransferase involved in cell wall biosynthesis
MRLSTSWDWGIDVKLTILNVAYPLALVGPDAVGGAEQILSQLDRGVHEAGHTSLVIAVKDSDIAGTHIPLFPLPDFIDDAAIRSAQANCRRRIQETLTTRHVDLIHMHGADFYDYLPPPGPPVLATLHMPLSWYPAHALSPRRPATWLNCVSNAQQMTCAYNPRMLPPVPNGTIVDYAPQPLNKDDYALVLGRICPEKGVHIAFDAAKLAGVPLIVAGQVFPYREHQDYFETSIKPRLDHARRYIGPVSLKLKRKLLAQARCLVVPSLVPETSSLAAIEALAAGTAVVAFGKGALPEVIDHGQTGYLVWDERELADGIRKADLIDPEACRMAARMRFSVDRMIQSYFDLYSRLVTEHAQQATA